MLPTALQHETYIAVKNSGWRNERVAVPVDSYTVQSFGPMSNQQFEKRLLLDSRFGDECWTLFHKEAARVQVELKC